MQPGAANDAARKEYGDWFAAIMRHEWFANGVMLGYRYDNSPIVWPDGTPAPPDLSHPYVQTARPGARAPHVWLADGRSTLDLFGRGFTLLRLGAERRPARAHRSAPPRERGVPLTSVALAEPEVLAAYERRLVLVRPDGHVAWRADARTRRRRRPDRRGARPIRFQSDNNNGTDIMTDALREKLINAGRVLVDEGQGDYVWGHISARLPDNPNRFLMKPGCIGVEEMTPDNIITVDIEGEKVAGDWPRHNEVYIHSEVMRARPDINCVIHTHPEHVVAFSSLGKPLAAISNDGTMFSAGVPVFSETTDLITDQPRGKAVAQDARPGQHPDPAQPRHRRRRPHHRGSGVPGDQAREGLPHPAAGGSRRRPQAVRQGRGARRQAQRAPTAATRRATPSATGAALAPALRLRGAEAVPGHARELRPLRLQGRLISIHLRESNDMAFQVRRVITGHDANGKAIVKIDEIVTNVQGGPAGRHGARDLDHREIPGEQRRPGGRRRAAGRTTLAGGTILRVVEFSPASPSRNHRTDSIDYIVVMNGEIDMDMDGTVVHLKAGDVHGAARHDPQLDQQRHRIVHHRRRPDRRQAGHRRRQGPQCGRLSRSRSMEPWPSLWR